MSKKIYENSSGLIATTLYGGADVGKVVQITLPYGAYTQLSQREAVELARAIIKGFGFWVIIGKDMRKVEAAQGRKCRVQTRKARCTMFQPMSLS